LGRVEHAVIQVAVHAHAFHLFDELLLELVGASGGRVFSSCFMSLAASSAATPIPADAGDVSVPARRLRS